MSNRVEKLRLSKNITCLGCSSRHLCLPSKFMDESCIDLLDLLIQKIRILNKREHLYYAYDFNKYIYAVHKGSCKEYWIDGNGNECVTNFYFPGDLVGLESATDCKHQLSVVALENSELCIIPMDELYKVMRQKEPILKRFITITGLKMQNDRSVKMGVTAEERVCDFLLNIANRYLERNRSLNNMYLPMTQRDISNYLGLSHETVSRILKHLENQNIIQLNNRKMSIINKIKLEKLGRIEYSTENKNSLDY